MAIRPPETLHTSPLRQSRSGDPHGQEAASSHLNCGLEGGGVEQFEPAEVIVKGGADLQVKSSGFDVQQPTAAELRAMHEITSP